MVKTPRKKPTEPVIPDALVEKRRDDALARALQMKPEHKTTKKPAKKKTGK